MSVKTMDAVPTVCEVCIADSAQKMSAHSKRRYRVNSRHCKKSALSAFRESLHSQNDSGFETASPTSMRASDLRASRGGKSITNITVDHELPAVRGSSSSFSKSYSHRKQSGYLSRVSQRVTSRYDSVIKSMQTTPVANVKSWDERMLNVVEERMKSSVSSSVTKPSRGNMVWLANIGSWVNEEDYRIHSYLNFVHKIDSDSQSSDQFPLSWSWHPIACPRYLVHMKAFDPASSMLTEAELRSRFYNHKLCQAHKSKQVVEKSDVDLSQQQPTALESSDKIDDVKSSCTEDDIADQLGILTQEEFLEMAMKKEGYEKEMDELILREDIVSRGKDKETRKETSSSQLPSLTASAKSNRERAALQMVEDDDEMMLMLPSLTEPSRHRADIAGLVQTPGYTKPGKDSTVQRKTKAANNRRAGQLLASQMAVEDAAKERDRKGWIFDDDDPFSLENLNQFDGKPGSRASILSEPHSLSPSPSDVGGSQQALTASQQLKKFEWEKAEEQRRKWGKAQVDNRYREEQERQRLAEERKKKAMKMKLARSQHVNLQKFQIDTDVDDGDLSDCDWLAQYCVFGRGALSVYREVFETLLGSSEESNGNKLSLDETLMAVTTINRELKTVEQEYILRICELLGYYSASGCDFKHFSLVAALSQRITSLDQFMRRIYHSLDLQAVDINTYFCKQLWKACNDPDTNLMSREKLTVELRAGGLSPLHEEYVKQALTDKKMGLDFLDFLTYIPLFILIHQSVIGNPFDDSRNR